MIHKHQASCKWLQIPNKNIIRIKNVYSEIYEQKIRVNYLFAPVLYINYHLSVTIQEYIVLKNELLFQVPAWSFKTLHL